MSDKSSFDIAKAIAGIAATVITTVTNPDPTWVEQGEKWSRYQTMEWGKYEAPALPKDNGSQSDGK
jgi:hypothetical protein